MKKLLLAAVLALAAMCSQAQTYGNLSGTALASAARTAATVNGADISNAVWKGGHFVVNVSAYTSGTYTPHIQGKNPVTGTYYDILVGTALNSTGTTVLKVYPGTTVAANVSVSDFLPQTFRVQLIGASAIMTISVGMLLEQ